MGTSLRVAASALITGGLLLSSVAVATTPRGTAQAASITLQQWYHQYGEDGTHAAVLRYAQQYQAKTGVNVKVSWIPGDYATKLHTALLGSNGPDVYEFWAVAPADVKAGTVAPLDDILTPNLKSDFDKAALQVDTINGHVYGIKMITDIRMLYYRKSLLAKAGITQPPATMADLLADAKKLTTGGVKGLFLGNDAGAGNLSDYMVYAGGVPLVSGTKVAFDTPRVVKAFEGLRALAKSGSLLLGFTTGADDPSAFIQGQTAIQFTGLWAMPAIQKALGNDFGVIPWPALDAQGSPVVVGGGWSAFVNGHSKNIAAAKALVKWMWLQNTTIQADWSTGYGFHIPPRASAAAAALKLKSGAAADAVKMLHMYGTVDSNLFDGAMWTALGDCATKVVTTNTPVATLVHQAAVTSQTALDQELK